MERRKLLALSTAALALVPFHGLRAQDSNKPFTTEQLDQMLAPIALYPDALLSQVLMAATYPLEVVEAARWSQANPNLKGDAAVAAEAAGNLKSTSQQKVTTQSSGGANAIVIEPASPEVLYVPYYNPAWAYGAWPYPAYPPPYYPPPPNYGAALMTGMMFGLGVAAGAAMFGGWHWGWSGGGWGSSYTTVNVNRATSISANNFNASRYANGEWNHDPAHRDGVPYRTPAEQARFNQVRPGAQQREQFRGQLDGTNRADAATNRSQAATNRSQAVTNREQANTNRAQADRSAVQSRGNEGRPSAFDGVDRGSQVNRDSERGNSSWGNRSFDRGNSGGGSFNRGSGGGFERGGGGGFRR